MTEYGAPGPKTLSEIVEHEALASLLEVARLKGLRSSADGVVLVARESELPTVCWIEADDEYQWSVYGVSRDPSFPDQLLRVFRKQENAVGCSEVAMIEKGQRGYQCQTVGTVASTFVPENYSVEACSAFTSVVEEFQKKEPMGRLVLLEGPPGTGKTRFVKGLMSACGLPTLLLPAKHIGLVEEGSVLGCIRAWSVEARVDVARRGVLLVIEDADSVLVPRQSDNMSALSALLNASDGLLGEVADLRVVVTTNAKKAEVDTALLREGRLFKHVQLGFLPRDKAVEIVRRLAPNKAVDIPDLPEYSSFSLARCYAIARGSANWLG